MRNWNTNYGKPLTSSVTLPDYLWGIETHFWRDDNLPERRLPDYLWGIETFFGTAPGISRIQLPDYLWGIETETQSRTACQRRKLSDYSGFNIVPISLKVSECVYDGLSVLNNIESPLFLATRNCTNPKNSLKINRIHATWSDLKTWSMISTRWLAKFATFWISSHSPSLSAYCGRKPRIPSSTRASTFIHLKR